jgi:hypothetical protein
VTRGRAIQTLERRLNYLRANVAVAESRDGWRGLDYSKAEASALELALAAFEDAAAIGLPELGRLTVAERQELRRLLEARERAA